MVGSTLSGSVVANTKTRCSGGSSTIFSRALKPCVVIMWASSTMNTRYRDSAGAKKARSRSSRVSSTPPCEAASSSVTSMLPGPPGARDTQVAPTPHGWGVGPGSQLRERARMRADEVLPQPRGPENRYAWLMRPEASAVLNGSVTCSCPTTSANFAGRYLRYRASATAARLPTIADIANDGERGPHVAPCEPPVDGALIAPSQVPGATSRTVGVPHTAGAV